MLENIRQIKAMSEQTNEKRDNITAEVGILKAENMEIRHELDRVKRRKTQSFVENSINYEKN